MDEARHNKKKPRCYRFDSVREIERFCRRRYGTLDVHSVNEDHSLWIKIGLGDGRCTRLLVVHFEGERAFVVALPEPLELQAQLDG